MDKAWNVEGGIGYMCPACKRAHVVPTGINEWQFNGSLKSPSFHPSVNFTAIGCHATITDGIAHFAEDCKHAFACKTIPLDDASTR